VKKAVLYALLTPHASLKKLQDENRTTELMLMQEELKTMPFGEVWEEYLRREQVELNPTQSILDYEQKVLVNRK